MHITYENPPTRPGALVAHLSGVFNVDAAGQLWESASQLVDKETRFVVFDFTRVTVLTSAGIGILIRLFTRLKGYEGGLAIFGCSSKIREIFNIVMVDEILKVRDNEDQAWDAIKEISPKPGEAETKEVPGSPRVVS
jgi:anti-anti-sigma factor